MSIRRRKLTITPDEWDFRSVCEEELMLRAKFDVWHAQTLDLKRLAEMDFDNATASLREKLERMPNCTNAHLIDLVFDADVRNREPAGVDLLWHHLSTLLPFELAPNGECPVALRFSNFTRPWTQMRRELGNEHLRIRLLPPPQENAAIFGGLGPPHTYEQLLEISPAVRHEELLIDWSYTINELTEAFRGWATDNRPLLSEESRPKSGKRSAPERMKWLAAYRLHYAGYTYQGAQCEISRRGVQARCPDASIVPLPI